MAREHWKTKPDEHDFPAAENYLSLVVEPEQAKSLVAALKEATTEFRQAKDLLRASQLALLPEDNFHVRLDLKKVKKGELLSPVLLVRGDVRQGQPLTVADGYHRICASYHLKEDANIPCRIASIRRRLRGAAVPASVAAPARALRRSKSAESASGAQDDS